MRRAVFLAVMIAACGGEAQDEAPEAAQPEAQVTEAVAPDAMTNEMFAAELSVDLGAMERQESGLYIEVLEEGDGPAAVPGDGMAIDYTVWLPDGSKLDSSFDHDPPAPYPTVLGETPLIAGWNEGVTGMRQGEKRRLAVPYTLAYGESGRPGVPPATPLVFEVTLVEHTPAPK